MDMTMTRDATRLDRAADRIQAWLDRAWPLWLAQGLDPHTGLFVEQLDHDGRPMPDAPRRIRVQGRQLWCVSRAIAAGHPGQALLDRALDGVARHGWAPDGAPGWAHVLAPDGTVLNPLRDSYDQAFLLFGLAGAQQAGAAQARAMADRTLAFLDGPLRDARDGSVWEGLPDCLPRRSNPHMHLLEAMLAWHALTGEAQFLARADAIGALFRDRFLDRDTGTLGEFFDRDWNRAPLPKGDIVEPGHHFEWSWLLHRLADQGGLDLRAEAGLLYRWGLRHGLDGSGLAIDESDRSGRPLRAGRRLWPQTELIKGHLANGAHSEAAGVAEAVLDSYLATPVTGLWIDRFDEAGRPDAPVVPASTLYHVVLAFETLLEAAGRRQGAA